MGIKQLKNAVRSLPAARWGTAEVAKLKQATGNRVKAKERTFLTELLRDQWQRFDPAGLTALQKLTRQQENGQSRPIKQPTPLTLAQRYSTNIKEQSALTFVSAEHGFLAISDRSSKVWQVKPSADEPTVTPLRKNDGQLEGLEGAIYGDNQLLVVSEDSRKVWQIDVDTAGEALALGQPELLGKLPKIGERKNKGWEGLALLPKQFSPDNKPRLLAVHEGFPKRVAIFDRHSLKMEASLKLPKEVKAKDLSDLTVDPQTGRLFLLSDESNAVYEMDLVCAKQKIGQGSLTNKWSLESITSIELPDQRGRKRLQPEGLAFDERGDLWVACEGKTSLLHLQRG